MYAFFYKNYWDVTHRELFDAVTSFFDNARLQKSVNHTFLALIPMMNWASTVQNSNQ
jgi:hypothetical protein